MQHIACCEQPNLHGQRHASSYIIFVQERRHVIVAGDMNDYDGSVKDSFAHEPTSMVLQLLKAPDGSAGNKLVSAGEHVKASDRFTDWCV
jgi:hypothetical protein